MQRVLFALLVILGTPAVATAQSTQISEIRSVLSSIANRENSQRPPDQGRIELSIDDQDQFTWKGALARCLQFIRQARLSDLDLTRSEIEALEKPQGDVAVKIPCRSGNCVRFEFGKDVWPVLGTCNEAVRFHDEVTYQEGFNALPFKKPSAEELLSALRRR
jgi:hypothetical protein